MSADRAAHSDHAEQVDVVVLGAGMAGLTAAYSLRDRAIVVLEMRDRVGGRTYSGGESDSWWNLGAQLFSSKAVADLARSLDIELISVSDADFDFVVKGSFARGNTPERLLARMKMPWRHKVEFAVAALRMRHNLYFIVSMSADERGHLDARSLQEVIGRVSPSSMRMLSDCCENAAGLPPAGASGLFGLVYGLGAFLDPTTKQHIYGVRGGTQQITLAMAQALAPDSVRLSATVEEVRQTDAGVEVHYRDAAGIARTLLAKECICALPSRAVLATVQGMPSDKVAALNRLTPYSSLISVAWPVRDGKSAPWDGVFVCPVTGEQSFNLITNYGYLAKQVNAARGGYLATLAAGAKADLFEQLDDSAVVERQFAELSAIFPEALRVIDLEGVRVQRWTRGGLPPMRPGAMKYRSVVRESVGRIHFCGDYTSDPGLPGANGSGRWAAKVVSDALMPVH